MNPAAKISATEDQDRQEALGAIASALAVTPGGLRPVDLVSAYFERAETYELAERPPGDLAAIITAHLALGQARRVGDDLVRVFTPRSEVEGFGAHGSTLVQVVTDDRPFLVDTLSMEISRLGWNIRRVLHPDYHAKRDADGGLAALGALQDDAPGTLAESWICFEVYPELGRSAEAATPALESAITEGLAAVRASVDDWHAMRERGAATITLLDESPQPVPPHQVRGAISLLTWLFDHHFTLLGYREYKVAGTAFTPVPGTGLGILRGEPDGDEFAAIAPGVDDDDILVITKDSRRSPVQRGAYLDYVGVRLYTRGGTLVGERRFLGLMAASAYTEPVSRVPLLVDKANEIIRRAGFVEGSHAANRLEQVITTYPRDEFFQAPVDELAPIISKAASLQDRRDVRLFLRPGSYGRFMSCMVYLPRDQYSTELRGKVQQFLKDELGAEALEYHVSLTESPLARLFIVVKVPQEANMSNFDPDALQRKLVEATRTWSDAFNAAAAELPAESRGVEFGDAYSSDFDAATAVKDLKLANALSGDDDMRFDLYTPTDSEIADLRFKVVTKRPMSLTVVMPHLAALGVDVTNEHPYTWDLRGEPVLVYDFGFRLPAGQTLAAWGDADRARFCDAFAASYGGAAEAGRMTKLVMTAKLAWQQVVYLRSISRYLQQAGIPFSQSYVAAALTGNPKIAAALVNAFEVKFDPARHYSDMDARLAAFDKAATKIEASLEDVASLDHDRILRMYVAILRAMRRTNAFAEDQPALAFKLAPRELALLPDPKPKFEIFVYSPEVQGVHLRFGSVARGGLRWSDRAEDFRTEVLGLVKAQMVKNTVIVPVGAKGGFVPQKLADPAVDRAAWQAGGVAAYKTFINTLLSITDNIVDGAVVPPKDIVRFDGDDPYLVVAADKGTATFSDTANGIAIERGFWLGDAFASGGSVGYDHKGMGITARGAWESVKRHFFEMGRDCQTEDFTCVGIGDMAGDVFGNGMLLSRHIKLVAAFNHMHVFLDPNPDAEATFVERQRLFTTPRTTWGDFDATLISSGGGVYPRSAKSIPITAAVRTALGLADGVTKMTPNDLINAILKAPVDLLWNGGIGTYVKSSGETNAQCGDKANDAVRVDGREVRAKVAGEGGNLGWTQKGRVEFAQSGGRVNTDFIDNSAGVDTSDHEVNIKILLAQEVAANRLTFEERNELLASMTDEVGKLVLAHNIDQNLALACSTYRSSAMGASHEAWMRVLEENDRLDRVIEALPSSVEMSNRVAAGVGLTRPELCTLLAYTKIWLADLILESDLPDDPYLADRLVTYFPKPLRERYAAEMPKHRLHREIVATVTVNRFVNSQGITSYYRLSNETGSDISAIVRAQLAARNILQVAKLERDIHSIGVNSDADAAVRVEVRRMVERATRWLLNNRRGTLDIKEQSAYFQEGVEKVFAHLHELMTPRQVAGWETQRAGFISGGVHPDLAGLAAEARYGHMALPIVQTAVRLGRDVMLVAETMFKVAEELGLDILFDRVAALPLLGRWDLMAQAAMHDDLQRLESDLTAAALDAAPQESEPTAIVEAWRVKIGGAEVELRTLAEISDGPADLARLSVALRTLRAMLS